MKYSACIDGHESNAIIGPEGLTFGSSFLDYADIKAFSHVNHRIRIELLDGTQREISMLGYSFDGFWEELVKAYEKRCLDAMFIEEQVIMRCEGEYVMPECAGRGVLILYPDSICILPNNCRSVRLPFSGLDSFEVSGYILNIAMLSGRKYAVGRMGYDTKPFFERAASLAAKSKAARARAIKALPIVPPYTMSGLFRTGTPDKYWTAAFAKGRCALELHTGDESATYLYRYSEPQSEFIEMLNEAMEAMSINREVIYRNDDELKADSLFRMAVARSEALRFLRARFAGRIIHNASHDPQLSEFLK